jgi:formyl-CoA transferase
LDARFASNAQRVRNREALIPLIADVTRTRSSAQWIALLQDKAVPCGPINDFAQAFSDPQVAARGLVAKQAVAPVSHAQSATITIATVATVASPLRLQDTPPVLRNAPPALGQHTDEVLGALGLDAERIAALRQQGVV